MLRKVFLNNDTEKPDAFWIEIRYKNVNINLRFGNVINRNNAWNLLNGNRTNSYHYEMSLTVAYLDSLVSI